MTHSNNITKKAFYKKFNNWIGSSFECSDAEGLLNEVWSWISQALTEAYKEGAKNQLLLDADTIKEARKEAYEAGKEHIDNQIRKAMNAWHKHEQSGLKETEMDRPELKHWGAGKSAKST